MAQPTTYNRAYNFENFQASSPTAPLPADQIDTEFNLIKQTLDEVLNNLAIIQRDDTALANVSVGNDQLKADVRIGINAPTTWATSTSYVVNDTVFKDNAFYRCLVSHTSGTFATDLAAEKWVLLADFTVDLAGAAAGISFSPAGDIAATDVQAAIEELNTEKQPKDAELTALAAVVSAANKIPYFTGSGAAALLDFLDEDNMSSDSATGVPSQQSVKAYAQPLDAELTALAAVVSAANKIPYFTGSGTADLLDFLDEDNMASNSATGVPSQQSVKAYADTMVPLAGGTMSGELNLADNLLTRPKLKDYGEVVVTIGAIGGGSQSVNQEIGNVFTATVDTSTTTFVFTNPPASGTAGSFTLILTNGGSQTVNWPASVKWAGGSAPTLTTSGVDVLTFVTVDGGTTWYGFAAGLDMS